MTVKKGFPQGLGGLLDGVLLVVALSWVVWFFCHSSFLGTAVILASLPATGMMLPWVVVGVGTCRTS